MSNLQPLKDKLAHQPAPLPAPTTCRALRQAARVTLADVAAAAGVSAPTVSRWESGLRNPSGARRAAYAEVLTMLRAAR